MKSSLRAGLSRTETVQIDRDRTIVFLGEENRVYSTPSMVNDVEYACFRLLAEHLEAGDTTLGVEVSAQHLAPTPLGETVEIVVTVRRIEGRHVHFDAVVTDRATTIGRARHERVVVDRARHIERLRRRRQAAG